METREIQKLLDFIAHSGLDEVSIETNELKISVKRYGGSVPAAPVATAPAAPAPIAVVPVPQPAAAPAAAVPAATPSNLLTVKSPMIGTFYRSSSPDSPMLAEVGDEVKPGKVLCVIEAMKLFNEIEAEVTGKIVKVLVENATPVEFDQPLFLVEPV